jgi:hypothetical protein
MLSEINLAKSQKPHLFIPMQHLRSEEPPSPSPLDGAHIRGGSPRCQSPLEIPTEAPRVLYGS